MAFTGSKPTVIAAVWRKIDDTGEEKFSILPDNRQEFLQLPAGKRLIMFANKYKEPGSKQPDFKIALADERE